MKKKITNTCLYLLTGVLLFPLVYQLFDGPITPRLKGWQAAPKKIDLTLKTWCDGTWQQAQEPLAQYHSKLKHLFIRTNNQLKFSLFEKINSKNSLLGKEGYFYEEGYLKSYLGLDYEGEKNIQHTIDRLQKLADSLQKSNTQLMILLAPGKGFYYPKFFPPPYDTIEKGTNNYETFIKQIATTSIPVLDCNRYFLEMKDTSAYPLFTEGGTHWSIYSSSFVIDTLVKTIEQVLKKDLPDYHFAPIEVVDKSRGADSDLYDGANLLWTKENTLFAYRSILMSEDTVGKYRPKVWTIGDSFFWTLSRQKLRGNFFDDSALFFYYFREVHGKQGKIGSVKDFGITRAQLQQQDIILWVITDLNIKNSGWGMISKFLNHYET